MKYGIYRMYMENANKYVLWCFKLADMAKEQDPGCEKCEEARTLKDAYAKMKQLCAEHGYVTL